MHLRIKEKFCFDIAQTKGMFIYIILKCVHNKYVHLYKSLHTNIISAFL